MPCSRAGDSNEVSFVAFSPAAPTWLFPAGLMGNWAVKATLREISCVIEFRRHKFSIRNVYADAA